MQIKMIQVYFEDFLRSGLYVYDMEWRKKIEKETLYKC